jgi:hypothetical protein
MSLQLLEVGSVIFARHAGIFEVGSVVHEGSDLHPLRQLCYPAHVVAMVVRDKEEVDLRNSSISGGRSDAICIARVESGPTCVDQERFSGWRDQQGCLPSLDIHKVDLQSGRRRFRHRRHQPGCRQDHNGQNALHASPHRVDQSSRLCPQGLHRSKPAQEMPVQIVRMTRTKSGSVFRSRLIKEARKEGRTQGRRCKAAIPGLGSPMRCREQWKRRFVIRLCGLFCWGRMVHLPDQNGTDRPPPGATLTSDCLSVAYGR